MDSNEKRIEQLEFVVSHLQATVDDLNAAVIVLGKQLESLEKRSHDLKISQQILQAKLESDGNLPFEKPPHY